MLLFTPCNVFSHSQGKFYLLIENFSQLYRMLVPIPLWFAFFTEYNYGGEYFAIIATTIYLILKVSLLRSFHPHTA